MVNFNRKSKLINVLIQFELCFSDQKQYEASFALYKQIDVKNSIEDLFGLARIFYKLEKYQQCTKSKPEYQLFIVNWLIKIILKKKFLKTP